MTIDANAFLGNWGVIAFSSTAAILLLALLWRAGARRPASQE